MGSLVLWLSTGFSSQREMGPSDLLLEQPPASFHGFPLPCSVHPCSSNLSLTSWIYSKEELYCCSFQAFPTPCPHLWKWCLNSHLKLSYFDHVICSRWDRDSLERLPSCLLSYLLSLYVSLWPHSHVAPYYLFSSNANVAPQEQGLLCVVSG